MSGKRTTPPRSARPREAANPAYVAGVVQLRACHGTLRQRIGSEHRLIFRLHPDRVQILDLINRRDLDRKIKALRAAG